MSIGCKFLEGPHNGKQYEGWRVQVEDGANPIFDRSKPLAAKDFSSVVSIISGSPFRNSTDFSNILPIETIFREAEGAAPMFHLLFHIVCEHYVLSARSDTIETANCLTSCTNFCFEYHNRTPEVIQSPSTAHIGQNHVPQK